MLNILKKLKNPFIIIAIGCAFSFAFFSLEVVEAQNFETDIESSIEIMNAGMPETTSGLSLRNFSVGGYALPGVAIFNLVSDGLQSASGFYDISMRNGITTYSTHYQTIMISPGFNGTVRTMHGSILAPLTEIPIESLGGLIRFHDMTGAPISELGIVYMPTPRFEVFGLREGEYWTNEDVTVRLTYDRDGILSSRTYNYNTLNQHFDLTFETAGYGLTSIKTPVQFNLNFQINRSLPQGSVTARNGNFDRSSPDHNSATNTFFYGYTNRSVEFHFFQNTNGNNVSVKIANEHPTLGFPEYTLSGNLVLLDSPGIYRITMTDLAGNQTSYRFVIEREIENISSTHNNSTPNITSIISGFTASNSGFIDLFDYIYSFGFSRQSSVTLSWIANPPSGNNVIANHNGNIVSSGFLNITAEGSHTVVFSDLAGNQKTFNFVIDRTPASGVLTGVTNGGFTNQNVLFSWTNKENGLAVNAEVTRPNGTMEVLSAQTLTFTEDGLYIIVLMDAIGNRSNDYSFTIDRRSTNAHLNFSALQINNHTRGAVNLFWTNFSNGNDVVSALISRNGNAAEIYTMNKNISEEGFFVITLTTRAGVISAHSFTIDNSLPTFSISETRGFSNSSLVLDGNNNARTNADSFIINFNPNQKNSLNLVSVLHNNTTFNNSFSVSSEGEHHFIIRDQIGNEVSFTITIDRTPPTINLVRSAGAQHIGSTSGIDGSINSNAFNFTLFFTWNKPGTTALLNRRTGLNFSDANDMHYSQGELIHLDGNYRLTVTDDVGNITIYFFEIRTTLPLDNFNALVNHNQSFAFRSQLWSVRDHNGTLYSFNNEEDARTFATWSEWQTIEQGPYDGSSQIFSNIHNTNSIPFHWPSHSWTAQWYYIYIDNLGNPIIFFGNPLFGDTAAIDSAIRFHVDRAITNGYLFMPTMISEIGQAFPGNPNIPNPRLQVPQDIFYRAIPFSGTGDQSEFPVIFFNRPSFPGLSNHNTNFRLRLGNTFSALMTHTELNNHIMNQTGSVIYHIQEIDFAGNIFEYRVVLVVNPPTFNVSTEFGNDISADFNNNLNSAATLFYTHRISLSAFDFFDSYNILEIRRVGEINWRRYWGGATAFLNESGVFEIRTRNRAGFISAIRTVNISLEEIQINVSEEINNSEDLDGFWFNISNLVEPNEIISITIWFNDIQIFVDSLGNPITSNRLSYFFSVNGRYTVQVVDRFNRMPVLTYELQRDLPVGRLFEFGSSLELQAGLTHFSNQGFFLNWSSAGAEAVWVFNGNEVTYTRNFIINAVGSHTIRLFHSSDPSIFREFYFVIDRTLPNAIIFDTNNVPIISGSRTNQNVIITWEEIRANGNIVSGTLNGLSINSGVEITEEGEFTLILRDSAGNSRTINFQIIKSPPTFQIWAGVTLILPETVTNQDVRVVWHDWSVTAVIFSNFNPARAYSSGSWIWEEGTHIIVLTDDAGNSVSLRFFIDKTPPIATFTNVVNNGVTNQNVIMTWNKNLRHILVNNVLITDFTTSITFTIAQVYNIVLIDLAGNQSNWRFEIDRTPPVGSLIGVTDGGITNNDVRFIWSDKPNGLWATATLNGEIYRSNTLITEVGHHEIILTCQAGNYSIYTFTISRTRPDGNLTTIGGSFDANQYSFTAGNGTHNFGFTNQQVVFTWDEDTNSATLNGNLYIRNTPITTDGNHIIILTCIAGNQTTFRFTIDTTAPIGILSGVSNNGFTNSEVRFRWEAKLNNNPMSATLNGETYQSNSLITAEGFHEIILRDQAGNYSVYSFTISRTRPTGTLSTVTGSFDSSQYFFTTHNWTHHFGFTNRDVIFTWETDTHSATLNGLPYFRNTIITESGVYVIVLTDHFGNERTFRFEIDKMPPIGTLHGVENGMATTNDVRFSWEKPNTTATLNGLPYSRNAWITEERFHTIILTDLAGNVSIYTFTIDLVLPVGVLETIFGEVEGTNILTNGSVLLRWDNHDYTATLNGLPYLSGTWINEDGVYTIILSKSNGTSRTFNIEITRERPIGTLHGVENNGRTNSNVRFSWPASLNFTALLNGNPYLNNQEITTEGFHSIILTDAAGNFSIFNFTIDRRSPAGYLSGVTNNGITNGYVSFSWERDDLFATLNGIPFISGSLITDEGNYIILLFDGIGNQTEFRFTINRTPAIGTLIGVSNGGFTNGEVRFNWDIDGASATLNGVNYQRNSIIFAEGHHTINLLDSAGNISTYTFTITRTNPTGTLNGTNQGFANSIVSFTWIPNTNGNLLSATLNGNPYLSGTEITEVGNHRIVLRDLANNETIFTFIIDHTSPSGTLNSVSNGGHTNSEVRFTWNDNPNGNIATATLNGLPYSRNVWIHEEGFHTIILTDLAGNYSIYIFTIIRTRPQGNLTGVSINGITNGNVFLSWDNSNYSATLNDLPYISGSLITEPGIHLIILRDLANNISEFRFTIDRIPPVLNLINVNQLGLANQMVRVSWDKPNSTALLNGMPYSQNTWIHEDGDFTIIVTDEAGNYSIAHFSIRIRIQNASFYELIDDDLISIDIRSSFWTNNQVHIFLSSENQIMINDELIDFESLIIIEEIGEYRIRIFDDFGNELIFNFHIVSSSSRLPNYLGQNIATVLLILLVSTVAIFILVKKIRAKNPIIKNIKK